MTTIGDLIRDHCHARHLSQSKLAARAGVDHSYVSRICSGDRHPSREAVLNIAASIGVDGLTPAETDELLAAGGYMPLDPSSLLADEPELVAVLTLLRSPATTDVRRVSIRAMLGALADLAQTERSQDPSLMRISSDVAASDDCTGQIPRVTLDPLTAAITAPSDRRAA